MRQCTQRAGSSAAVAVQWTGTVAGTAAAATVQQDSSCGNARGQAVAVQWAGTAAGTVAAAPTFSSTSGSRPPTNRLAPTSCMQKCGQASKAQSPNCSVCPSVCQPRGINVGKKRGPASTQHCNPKLAVTIYSDHRSERQRGRHAAETAAGLEGSSSGHRQQQAAQQQGSTAGSACAAACAG